ncbi:TetR/AcrR family transcriptional regulator [Ilumatobacter coccineus]|uniref:Putative TetR family transcriptional regulator n=1 Tax=Ilumatobacter coccineus (strain NBRC 103263 / KCTC 29153 / YM16-304) TaxID=1313172 RepID=A0A6C7ECY7_ILUCY|nr:TetR/AcrR family transcriptional regulator [Ilumatobacter coccineus]BAN04321.1 putative TetR family transcriptional regulator [Ilumatobacter coccineus YM16-304]
MAAQRGPTQRRSSARIGRPAKDDNVVATGERLIAAAVDEFVERGFSRASLTRIAERAGISGPAVYKHFAGKADLLIHAARHSLEQTLSTIATPSRSPHDIARRWLADDFAPTRRLLLELHVAAGRETDLASLLTDWHLERTAVWQTTRADSVEQIKVFYLLLLGLAQIDSLTPLDTSPDAIAQLVDRMVDALFADTV